MKEKGSHGSWDRIRLVMTHAFISHGTGLSLFK